MEGLYIILSVIYGATFIVTLFFVNETIIMIHSSTKKRLFKKISDYIITRHWFKRLMILSLLSSLSLLISIPCLFYLKNKEKNGIVSRLS